MRTSKIIIALFVLIFLSALTGCQATLVIVPSTFTPTPTAQPGLEAIPNPSATPTAAAAVTTTVTSTATPSLPAPGATSSAQVASPTPTASDTPTVTATATSSPTATARPSHTPTVRATPTPTGAVQSQRLTPKPAPRLSTTPTRRPSVATATRTRARPSPSATLRASPTRRPPTRTPTPARIRIAMTEAQLNKTVRDAIAKDPNTPVRSISIDTIPGQVVITAQARLGFFTVNLEITIVVEVRNGKATPVIQEIKVNGSPASGFLRQQVEAALQPYLNQIADISKDVYVESVVISDNALTIEGRPK